jgi:hypothetical protein
MYSPKERAETVWSQHADSAQKVNNDDVVASC